MNKIAIILILLNVFILSCAKKTEETTSATNYFYDPKIPFGTIKTDSKDIVDISNLQADVSVLDKVTLSWKIPPVYTTMNYKIYLYKVREPSDTFSLPSPAQASSGADFYLKTTLIDDHFVDQNTIDSQGFSTNDIEQGVKYSYWVYVNIDDKFWSAGKRIDIITKTPTTSFKLPEASKFWDNKKWTLGYDPSVSGSTTLNYLQSMNPGQSIPSLPKGGMALAYAGNVAYFADTDNNRILIYKRDGALSCNDLTDPESQQACLMNYSGAPLTAANVLGQATASSTYPCGDPLNQLGMNECLTRPTKVEVIGDKLFVSDSGNNRIVVFDTLPLYGCDVNAIAGYVYKRECTPNWVIGKAGLFDTNTYNLTTNGSSALNYPTDIAAKGDDLYIADTMNNRIVRINNYANKDIFSCTNSTWGTSQCEFSSVFGQKNFTSNESLWSLYSNDNSFIKNTALKNLINDTYSNLSKRYFRYPSRIVFNKNEQLMVLSNESFEIPNDLGGYSMLRSRILVFDKNYYINDGTSNCSSATFDSGGCDSVNIIGQEDPNKIFPVSANTSTAYNQLNAGMYSLIDFDIRTVPNETDSNLSTELMLGVEGTNNSIYVWNDWSNPIGFGYPSNSKILDPDGALNTTTNTLKPNLQNLCSIRFENFQSNIYVQDCSIGRRVYEIQAYELPTN